jgi:hypothetical protein
MKKISILLIALVMALSLTACSKPATAQPEGKKPVEETEIPVEEEVTVSYPLSYTPAHSMAEINDGNKDISRNASVVFFSVAEPTTIQYTELARQLESIYKEEEIVWPELDDEWKSYKYSEITNVDGVSTRTMDVEAYKEKGDKVINEHIDWLKGIGGDYELITDIDAELPVTYVPFSCIKYDKSLTNKELAGIAYEAFYLQTWHLVPAENQGVMIQTPDGDFTAEQILEKCNSEN